MPSAVTCAYGCGNTELVSYHDGRGPGGDRKDKGEDEENLDHGRASALNISALFEIGAHRRFRSGQFGAKPRTIVRRVSNVAGCCEKNTSAWVFAPPGLQVFRSSRLDVIFLRKFGVLQRVNRPRRCR